MQLEREDLVGLMCAAGELAVARTVEDVVNTACVIVRRMTGADGARLVLREAVAADDTLGQFVVNQHEALVVVDRVSGELLRTAMRSLIIVRVEPDAALAAYWLRPNGSDVRAAAVVDAIGQLAAAALDTAMRLAAEVDARRKAERAARAKDELIALLGHELRNKLAPMMTALHLIELRGDDPCNRERSVIERGTNQVAQVVDDVLDISRIARGSLHLRRTVTELRWIVARAVELAAAEEHVVDMTIPTGLAIDADIDRMTQVVATLVVRAAQHTPRGGRIALAGDVEGGDVRLVVRDTGSGIDPDALPTLFEPASRNGLALAIVRGIVELHGGVVSAASDGTGRGSTFTLRLPRAELVETAPARARGTRPLKVLVVDDNVDAGRTLGELLQLMGHEARVVNDGAAALVEAEGFTPEVAFLDLGMPSVDGYELAERMRASRSEPSRVSIVAVTGIGVDRQRARASGFDDHLVKPLSAEKLRSVLEKLTS